MRIRVQGNDCNVRLTLPTALLCNRFVLRHAFGSIRMGNMKTGGLSRRQVKALFSEIRRIKKKHGSWTLVEVHSADGDQVVVQL